ncbi:hypothetical protein TNCV_795701, partial [Trichonephila clavipes]
MIWGVIVSGVCDTSPVAFSSCMNPDSRIGWT